MTKLLPSLSHTRHADTSPVVYFTNLVPSLTPSHVSTCFTHFTSLDTSRFEPTWTGRRHLSAIIRKMVQPLLMRMDYKKRRGDWNKVFWEEGGDKKERTERTWGGLENLLFFLNSHTSEKEEFSPLHAWGHGSLSLHGECNLCTGFCMVSE